MQLLAPQTASGAVLRAGMVGLATFVLFWASREFKRAPREIGGRVTTPASAALPVVDQVALARFVAVRVRSPDARPTPSLRAALQSMLKTRCEKVA